MAVCPIEENPPAKENQHVLESLRSFKEGKLEQIPAGWAVCQANMREEAIHAGKFMQNQNHEEYRQTPTERFT